MQDILKYNVAKYSDISLYVSIKALNKDFRKNTTDKNNCEDDIIKLCSYGYIKEARLLFNLCSERKKDEICKSHLNENLFFEELKNINYDACLFLLEINNNMECCKEMVIGSMKNKEFTNILYQYWEKYEKELNVCYYVLYLSVMEKALNGLEVCWIKMQDILFQLQENNYDTTYLIDFRRFFNER